MSSPDIFLSSPRVTRRTLYATGASSPDLPDVHDIIKSQKPPRPPLKSGSKAAPIPDDAFTGFTTARGLWQSAQASEAPSESLLHTADPICLSGEDDSVCIVEARPLPAKKVSKSRNPRRQKEPKPALPSPPVQVITEALSPRNPPTEQPWRKYRSSPKSAVSSPTGENTGHDAPPSAQIPLDEPRLLETESVSKHFKAKRAAPKKKETAASVASEPVDLDPAPLRRLDWTPPSKVNGATEGTGDQDTSENVVDSPGDEDQVEFKDLLRDFSCSATVAQPSSTEPKEVSAALGKRKLIEPVVVRETTTSERSRSTSPTKKKAPKKPRTITELATAAYRIHEEPLPPTPSILNYISVEADGEGSEAQPKDNGKSKPRKKAAPKASKKKSAPAKPVLLSPGAALKHVSNQDFVFGTSSQLAQERSPTFLRTWHTAMRQSNQIDEGDMVLPLNSDAIEPPEQRPRLWEAAARDIDGELFDVEVINLVDASPTLSRIAEEADPFGYVNGEGAEQVMTTAHTDVDDSLVTLPDLLLSKFSEPSKPSATHAAVRPTTPTPMQTQSGHPMAPLADASSQMVCDEDVPEPELPPLAEQPQRPAYETFTDAQLAKQVSKYGFKPVKRRATMIALLDNCWKSQLASGRLTSISPKRGITTTAAKSVASPARARGRPKKSVISPTTTVEPPHSAQITTPAKKPRGRPRKDAANPSKAPASRAKKALASPTRKGKGRAKSQPAPALTKNILEIPDSESDQGSIRSASRSASPEPMFSSPVAAANLSINMDDDTDMSLTMTPTEQQASLFEHITKAVLSAPRSNDVANPSWYEKMLLYDPVVVEDLAVWLNLGQLTSVGYDGEVSPAEVKKWCESKSVCCLWRDTHRGKERKRY